MIVLKLLSKNNYYNNHLHNAARLVGLGLTLCSILNDNVHILCQAKWQIKVESLHAWSVVLLPEHVTEKENVMKLLMSKLLSGFLRD